MRGFASFLRKEALEIVRTWRIWVLPGMVLFFALSGPVLAKYTADLLRSLGGSTGGMQIILPEPTYVDSYAGQWVKNLSQLVLFAIIIIYGGLISAERKKGTAALVLTKPVSREAFVVAKFLTHAVFLTLVVVIGALVTWGVTAAVFGGAPFVPLASSTLAWLCYGLMVLALMTLLSALVNSQAGSAGIGFGIFALSGILGLWEAARLYSPIGLLGIPTELASGKHPAVLWPVLTSLAVTMALVAIAAAAFRRKEL